MRTTDQDNEKLLESVAKELLSLGEISLPYTVKKHAHQGYMSQVYMLSSEDKELVIHVAKPFQYHGLHKTWEKFKAINTLVTKETSVPVSRMIFTKLIDGTFVTVQTKLPGEIVASVTIVDNILIITWHQDKKLLIPQAQRMLADIHSIPITGFGFPVEKNGKLEGTHATWKEFFLQEVPVWLEGLKERGSTPIIYPEMFAYVEKFFTMIPERPPSLIHGDLGNPSNVLAEQGVVTGVIDWEWSIIGDPAWEFCDPGWVEPIATIGLDAYFQVRKMDTALEKETFMKRTIFYRPLHHLWWAYAHKDDEDTVVYDTLILLVQQALLEAKAIMDR